MKRGIIVKTGNLEARTKELSIPFRFYGSRDPPVPIPLWRLIVEEVEEGDKEKIIATKILRYDADKEAFFDGAEQGQSYSYDGEFTKKFSDLVDSILPEIMSEIDDYLSRNGNLKDWIREDPENQRRRYDKIFYFDLSK